MHFSGKGGNIKTQFVVREVELMKMLANITYSLVTRLFKPFWKKKIFFHYSRY